MIRWAGRRLTAVFSFVVVVAVVVVAFGVLKSHGLLSAFGIKSESHDTQVIQAITREQQIVLVGLGIQGIKETDQSSHVFGVGVPFSDKKVLIQYNFDAKLGLDGKDVSVTRQGPHAYAISVARFIFMGHDHETFKVAAQEGGLLSWTSNDIDQARMITEVLNDPAQQSYLSTNTELLQDQTKRFYDALISSIDPQGKATYTFQA